MIVHGVLKATERAQSQCHKCDKLMLQTLWISMANKNQPMARARHTSTTFVPAASYDAINVRLNKNQLETLHQLFNKPIQGTTLNINSESNGNFLWIFDSGTTDHMTCNSSFLHNIVPARTGLVQSMVPSRWLLVRVQYASHINLHSLQYSSMFCSMLSIVLCYLLVNSHMIANALLGSLLLIVLYRNMLLIR